ncbi:MAG: hypothetical protein ACYC1L_14120 [Alphaproteobacteria bacterium]
MAFAERLAAIRRWFNPGPIQTAAELQKFLDERAAFVAQKSISAYCQMKTRTYLLDLLKEKTFQEAFDRSRWESYAIVLSDLLVIMDGDLGTGLKEEDRAVLAARLEAMYRGILDGHARPAHRPEGWADAFEAFDRRLAVARLAPPKPVLEVASHSAERLFALLPIHTSLRTRDGMSVEGGVRFLIAAATDALARRMRREPLLADLLGR